MRPLLLFGVLYVVFTEVVRFGGGVEHYPVYLLSAIVLFTYFSETTSRGVTSLVERENLLRKMRFPRMVIPLSVALHALFNLGLNLDRGVRLRPGVPESSRELEWLELVPSSHFWSCSRRGVTMLLSALYVRYRDMQPIWEVALQMLFYASPVIYVTSHAPRQRRARGHGEPPHRDPHPDAARADRPERADRRRGDRRERTPSDSARSWSWWCSSLGAWVFTREAPRMPRSSQSSVVARDGSEAQGDHPVAKTSSRCSRSRCQPERERPSARHANAAVAAAQDRSYWLDRWRIDLNALMRRRGASEFRAGVRALRAVYRALDHTIDRARRSMRAVPGRTAGLRRVLDEERAQAAGAAAVPGAGSRLTATAVSDRLRDRLDEDDPHSLVAAQRADMLVEALSTTGCETRPGQRWLGLGTGADGVLTALGDAFPGLGGLPERRRGRGVRDLRLG